MSKILEGNNVKRAFSKTEYTPEMLEELHMCSPDYNKDAHFYFITTFGYTKHPTKGMILYKPFEYQIGLIDNMHNHRFNINMLGRQLGKALGLDTPVLTTSGFKTIGTIEVGDMVFHTSGAAYPVIGVTETHLNRKCYNVHFDSGESFIADAQHEWMLTDISSGAQVVKKTEDMLLDFYEFTVPVAEYLNFNIKAFEELTKDIEFCSPRQRMRHVINQITSQYATYESGDFVIRSEDEAYLEDLQFMISTVGVKAERREGEIRYSNAAYNGECHQYNHIVRIEPHTSVPVRCIEVDSPDHTYLIGKSLITTHNCVVGDTKINVRNKKTGETMELTIEEFHEMAKSKSEGR